MITFSSGAVEDRNIEIFESLPSWKTHVLSIQKSDADVPQVQSVKFLVAIKTRDEFAQWLKQYEDLSKATYSIRSSENGLGKRIVFKQRLQCHHNTQTKTKKLHDPTMTKRTRNTNCPSRMTVKLHAVHSIYRGKDKEKGQLFKEMPCEIDLVVQHNHGTGWLESPSGVDLITGNFIPVEVEEVISADVQEELAATADNRSIIDSFKVKLQKLNARLEAFAEKSPEEMEKGIDILLESVEKVKTPSACASLLASIRECKSRRNRGKYTSVQPTAISRQKKKLVGCRSCTGRRPRSLCKENRGYIKAAGICDMVRENERSKQVTPTFQLSHIEASGETSYACLLLEM